MLEIKLKNGAQFNWNFENGLSLLANGEDGIADLIGDGAIAYVKADEHERCFLEQYFQLIPKCHYRTTLPVVWTGETAQFIVNNLLSVIKDAEGNPPPWGWPSAQTTDEGTQVSAQNETE